MFFRHRVADLVGIFFYFSWKSLFQVTLINLIRWIKTGSPIMIYHNYCYEPCSLMMPVAEYVNNLALSSLFRCVGVPLIVSPLTFSTLQLRVLGFSRGLGQSLPRKFVRTRLIVQTSAYFGTEASNCIGG
jgi:hypothetical protein